jgi:hypothetical protein
MSNEWLGVKNKEYLNYSDRIKVIYYEGKAKLV